MTEHGLAGVEIGFFFTLSAKTGYESKFVPQVNTKKSYAVLKLATSLEHTAPYGNS